MANLHFFKRINKRLAHFFKRIFGWVLHFFKGICRSCYTFSNEYWGAALRFYAENERSKSCDWDKNK